MKEIDNILTDCSEMKLLAKGGQKTVYSAVHREYGDVVVKQGNYRLSNSLERINREVNFLKELESEYYPKVFEFIVDSDEREFLIIEQRLEAVELGAVATKFHDDNSIINLLRDLVRALNVIWSKRVVHRDLKPNNILITPNGSCRIIDLGIARFLDKTSLTHSLAPHGPATPIYAAPEQLLNKKSMIGIRTDFFLLGIIVLELAQGFHPFDPCKVGNQSSIVDNILSGTYMPLRGRDPILEKFISRVLEVEPFRRFRTVNELANHLKIEI